MNKAELKERSGDASGALAAFQDIDQRLRQLRADYPGWETVLITNRLDDCRAKVAALNLALAAHPPTATASTNNVASPAASTNVAIPAAPTIPLRIPLDVSPQSRNYP